MLVEGSKIVLYLNENNLNVNYARSNFIHFNNSIDVKVSLNNYVVSETNHMTFLGWIIGGRWTGKNI